jgi:hypothetical protein
MLLNPGRCHARWFFHALHKGMNGPQLAVGSWEETTPTAFAVIALECTQSVEAFPTLFLGDVTLPKALWIGYRNLRTSK